MSCGVPSAGALRSRGSALRGPATPLCEPRGRGAAQRRARRYVGTWGAGRHGCKLRAAVAPGVGEFEQQVLVGSDRK